MPYHIIVKQQEREVIPKLIEKFTEPKFIVREVADSGEHWHIWLNIDVKEDKLRRELDKCRVNKSKGVSVRKWDANLAYFCKGQFDGLPEIVHNDGVLTEKEITDMHTDWWINRFNIEGEDPDFKLPKLLDELVDECRDKDWKEKEVIECLIGLLERRGGRKMFCNRNVGQAYIRTALMYTSNKTYYTKKMYTYYFKDLFC